MHALGLLKSTHHIVTALSADLLLLLFFPLGALVSVVFPFLPLGALVSVVMAVMH